MCVCSLHPDTGEVSAGNSHQVCVTVKNRVNQQPIFMMNVEINNESPQAVISIHYMTAEGRSTKKNLLTTPFTKLLAYILILNENAQSQVVSFQCK